jgi:hypothetical protein
LKTIKRLVAVLVLAGVAFVGASTEPKLAKAYCDEWACGTTDVLVDSWCDDRKEAGYCPVWVNTYDRYVTGCDYNPNTGMCYMTFPRSGIFVCNNGPECYQSTFEERTSDECAPCYN